MNLLMVAPCSVRAPRAGDGVRVYELAKSFASMTNLTFVSNATDGTSTATDLPRARHIALRVAQRNPLVAAARSVALWQPYEEARTTTKLNGGVPFLGNFDVAYLQLPRSWHVWQRLRRIARPRLLVMDLQNDDTDAWEQKAQSEASAVVAALCRFYARRATAAIRKVSSRSALLFCVSDRDRDMLIQHAGQWLADKLFVIPNGARVQQFRRPDSASQQGMRLAFVGSLDVRMNQVAVRTLLSHWWPAILNGNPDARLQVIGRNPPEWLRGVQAPRVEVVASPDDVRSYLWNATAFLAPYEAGGGSKIKLIEAMAAGTPVVATATAMQGIPAIPDVHYVRVSRMEEVARAVNRLHADDRLRRQIVANAFELISRYDWDAIASRAIQLMTDRLRVSP